MLGAIAGDIIGSAHEGAQSRGRHFTLFTPRSRFTDDSVLTVAVAHSLRTGSPYATALRDWARRYPTAGYGSGFQQWFEQDDAGPYNSFGNGAAMRVAAVAWAFDSMDEVLDHAQRTAAPTHDHPEGIRGARAIAAAILAARTGSSKEDIARLLAEQHGYECRIRLSELEERGGFDVTCQVTVPSAVAAFLHSKDFEDAVRIAVSLGGDTDTLACIAGALAEAHYGIPPAIQAEALRHLDAPLREEVQLFARHYHLAHLAPVFPELHMPRSQSGLPSGVLVECSCVIVRIDAIHRRLRGGWRMFVSMAPSQTLCADTELASVGFMSEKESLAFARNLAGLGLKFLWEGNAIDIAIADHVNGLRTPCDWIDVKRVTLTPTGSRVMVACIEGSEIRQVAAPEVWTYRNSLSHSVYYSPCAPNDKKNPRTFHIKGGPE
jgi:ADP-ribosylglycohydrolase